MSETYLRYFGFQKEPFIQDIAPAELLETQTITELSDRVSYVIRLGNVGLLTGHVGSGKSTALRAAQSRLHPSRYLVLPLVASSGSILEFYRKLTDALQLEIRSLSKAVIVRAIQRRIVDLVKDKRLQPVVFIDEANLLRTDVLSEIHTLTQFEGDSKPWLPLIMAGQDYLVDKLQHFAVKPLADRVVCRYHLGTLSQDETSIYLKHHLNIAGVKKMLYDDAAVSAIQANSGGLYRKTNHLARGALVAAAVEKTQQVTPEHVRIASTELI